AYASLRRMRAGPAIVSIDATERQASEEMTSPLARATYAANIRHDGLVFAAASAVTATSEWAARDLRTTYPDCAEKVHVMPYPVPSDGFDPSWLALRADRAARAHDNPVRFLFIGGDFPRKGGPVLIAAWRAAGFGARAVLDLVTDWPIAADALPERVRVVRGVKPDARHRRSRPLCRGAAHAHRTSGRHECPTAGLRAWVGPRINATRWPRTTLVRMRWPRPRLSTMARIRRSIRRRRARPALP